MTTRTILLTGARGGHGTTTVATALALYAAGHGATALVTAEVGSAAALIGIALPVTDESVEVAQNLVLTTTVESTTGTTPQTVVIDAGLGYDAAGSEHADEHYVVLRGPCYVALATLLVPTDERRDGIILVAEPKRSLSARDVTDVLDVPVIATIDVTPDVARTIDAGLLISRLHRLREFAPLRALSTDPYAGRLRPSTAHPRQRLSNPFETHTDLPLSQCDNGAVWSRAVKCVAYRASRPYVDGMWRHFRPRLTNAEHRQACAWGGGLLHRRGRDVGGGLLHGQG